MYKTKQIMLTRTKQDLSILLYIYRIVIKSECVYTKLTKYQAYDSENRQLLLTSLGNQLKQIRLILPINAKSFVEIA